MAVGSSLSRVFPLGSRINDLGRLEVGGCDTIELARQFGTPAYVVAEDDLRTRARAFVQAGRDAGHEDFAVLFASKAFPCTAVMALFAEEGLWCDVASEGELHLALGAGFPGERIVVHGNAKSNSELELSLQAGVGLIVIDNIDEIGRLARLLDGRSQDVLLRVTPDVRGETHEKISTGQANSKFGFSIADVPEAVRQVEAVEGLKLRGLHAHVGSQLLELDPFRRAVAEIAKLTPLLTDASVIDVGGGLGVRYVEGSESPPEIEEYVTSVIEATREAGLSGRLLIEPGRSLTANGCVTLYTVESVKRNVSTWVAVDGGMSDNLRPMLYGARYEAHVADHLRGSMPCVLAGKHCESGDVIVREALLDDPREGDVIVTPSTGAYGYAMGSNYNGVLRAPVIFCKDGAARAVVRRETLDELSSRDVR
ncbi:MAG TPA: diaminopimelate decarboxylase [Solirubrobacteraceae bacterium]|jgi:diaminopimelate decarboxylase